jgi:predicted amidohydrolase
MAEGQRIELVSDTALKAKGTATELRVAVLQTAPVLGAVEANLREIEELVATASAPDLVVTCELSVSGFVFAPDQTPTPLDTSDVRLRRIADLAPAVSVGIVERASGVLPYNSSVLFGDSVGVQRKLHLVSYAPWNEQRLFEPGTGLSENRVNGVQVATLICNDAWHPVMPWLAAHTGAEVLLIPAASLGGAARVSEHSWDVILTHTARILQCFVVFANRVGDQDGNTFWGGSRILDPSGAEVVRAGGGREVIEAVLDLEALRRLRRDAPLLDELRPQLVRDLLSQLPGGGRRV